jgi:hypothetical protein
MIRSSIFLLIITFSLISCTEKYQPISSLHPNSSIIGAWEWQRTELVNWSGRELITPEEVGYTETWIFQNDNLFQSYRNNILHTTSYYRVTEHENSIPKLTIGDWASATFEIKNNGLIYSTAFVDGPTRYFVRCD